MKSCAIRVGLISDTHGLLRPEALAALRGSDFIVHAGDVGDASILEHLSALAPVTAVRGNNDHGAWAARLPDTDRLLAGGMRILVLHDLAALDDAATRIDVVVSGHSHRAKTERRADVLYVNPGSAGPRRFWLPISVGMLTIDAGGVTSELFLLDHSRAPERNTVLRRGN